MNWNLFADNLLFELEQLCYLLFKAKIPDFGYLFASTTILLFILDIKNTYKIKKLSVRLKELENSKDK